VRRLVVTASVVPSSPILVTLMEALNSSETSVLTRATRRNTPEDTNPPDNILAGPYAEQDQRNSYHSINFSKIYSNIMLPPTSRGFLIFLFIYGAGVEPRPILLRLFFGYCTSPG
jgi:hypothetical protein